jgi:uncharacterized protein
MPVLLPVAELSVSLVLLLVVGGVVGSLSGLFGVGGGFLMTPILMMVGVPPTVAAASDSCQIVATSSSGMAAHSRLGNVDFKMGAILLAGGLAGAELGVHAIKLLRALGEADLVITLAYIFVLGSLGSYMFFQSFQTLRRGALAGKRHRAAKGEGLLNRLPWQMEFPRSGVRHSILIPLFLSALVGILASVMGVGGGFVMIPMMVYLLGMPTHVAVGTSLFQILFLCAGVTYMQAATNQTVDLLLVLPLALGSAVGAQVGARLGRLLRGEQLMILLAVLVLGVTGKMAAGLVVAPSNLLKPAEIYRREEITHAVPEAQLLRRSLFPPQPWRASSAAGAALRPARAAAKFLLASPPLSAGPETSPERWALARLTPAHAAAWQPPLADHERNNSPPETAPRTTASRPGCSCTYRAGYCTPSAAPACRDCFRSPRAALS